MTSDHREATRTSGRTSGQASDSPGLRIDRWLWAARFFKTRSNAAEAVNGGHVQVEAERVKPARKVRVGDRVRIRRGAVQWEVIVQAVSSRRGPATEARQLYSETPISIERREREAELRRLDRANQYRGVGRPSRRERQEIDRLTGRAKGRAGHRRDSDLD